MTDPVPPEVPLPETGPWLPPPGNRPPLKVVDRALNHRLGKLLSGLPGEFEFVTTKARLNLFLDHVAGSSDRGPYAAIFEPIDTVEDLSNCLRLIELKEKSSAGSFINFVVQIEFPLYASAYSRIGDRVFPLPDVSSDQYRGDHSVQCLRRDADGTSLIFRHNWDGWSQDWTMPWAYVEDLLIGGLVLHSPLTGCSVGSEGDECREAELHEEFLSGAVRTPWNDDDREVVTGLRSHSALGHREVWQNLLYFDAIPELFGWVLTRVSPVHVPRVFELFVHPQVRRTGFSRLMLATTLFDLYIDGHREVDLEFRRADEAAKRLRVCYWPRYLRGLQWHEESPGVSVSRTTILGLMLRMLHGAHLQNARRRGVLLLEDFRLDVTIPVPQRGIKL